MRLQVASDQLEVSEEVDARTIPGTVGDSLNHPFGVTDEIDSRIRWVGKPFRVGKACPQLDRGSCAHFRSLVPKAAVGMIRECAARRQYSICPD